MDVLPGMSAEAFYQSSSCPLCCNVAQTALDRINGRLVCPCCNASLVVSGNGQFVRDPFTREQLISIQQLRRQSRPLARLLRDMQTPLRTLLGGVAIVAIGGLAWANFVGEPPTFNPGGEPKIERSN
ncbi:hypothetical protein IQ266_17520 [filamentous cyanobacterium LEGE 11480]|uniref:Uncharacterized protein n=1 Tax=Romeriopsis navalis LEGE 11480 TaxID=2777977 RepID=A0A928Z5R1_9CYAN|nr:hypothetical protein [Romeriopsis navalis]MBE9031535.1 hypothetical protein [Romeriopsis navalis LEGE 11480]